MGGGGKVYGGGRCVERDVCGGGRCVEVEGVWREVYVEVEGVEGRCMEVGRLDVHCDVTQDGGATKEYIESTGTTHLCSGTLRAQARYTCVQVH